MEFLDDIRLFINHFLCGIIRGHEYETGVIESGTMCDINSWCKYCGKTKNYE